MRAPLISFRRSRFDALASCLVAFIALAVLAGCRESGATEERTAVRVADTISPDIPSFDSASVLHIPDTAAEHAPARALPRVPRLSARADSIADALTFIAKTQQRFLAAARGKRLLIDLGRVDATLRTPERMAAYLEAVKELSPVQPGARFRLHGPWGASDATVTGFSQWNGRIVATVQAPPEVDSLARLKDPLVALAVRADSETPPVPDTCDRVRVTDSLTARTPVVRDSLTVLLAADTVKMYEGWKKSRHVQASEVVGCFGPWRAVMFVNQTAGNFEYVRQLAVLLDSMGVATPLRVNDLRFKAHEALRAMDVDGDGVDDVAVRGRGENMGGTVLLRLDPVQKRLTYVVGGFAWESF